MTWTWKPNPNLSNAWLLMRDGKDGGDVFTIGSLVTPSVTMDRIVEALNRDGQA